MFGDTVVALRIVSLLCAVASIPLQAERVSGLFTECVVAVELDNGVDVDNEEQRAPVTVCTAPTMPWPELWPQFRHLD